MDVQGFRKIAQSVQDLEVLFDLMNGWAAVIIGEIEAAGGRVIKFIGDSCLSVFAEDRVDAGLDALVSAKGRAESYLESRGFRTRMNVTAHFGEAIIGEFGAGGCRGIDVFGDTVNVAASLERGDHSGQLVISAQAFRKLGPESRKRFHKHTPPIVYVAGQPGRAETPEDRQV